jgi:hypothetical protein
MYLTYDEYIQYGGTLDETTFSQYGFECSKLIDLYTAERVKDMATVPEAVKRCMMALLYQEQIYNSNVQNLLSSNSDGSAGKLVSSFTTDGYQESYATGGSDPGSYLLSIRKSVDATEKDTIKAYLAYERNDDGVLLLCRGVFS